MIANPESSSKLSADVEEVMDCEIFEVINKIKKRLDETAMERKAAFRQIEYQVRETYQGNH